MQRKGLWPIVIAVGREAMVAHLKGYLHGKWFRVAPCRTTPCDTVNINPDSGCMVSCNTVRHEKSFAV
jgi:hypothetical protein